MSLLRRNHKVVSVHVTCIRSRQSEDSVSSDSKSVRNGVYGARSQCGLEVNEGQMASIATGVLQLLVLCSHVRFALGLLLPGGLEVQQRVRTSVEYRATVTSSELLETL